MGNPTFMLKNILFVVNPISGGTAKEDLIDTVMEYGRDLGYSVRLYETTGNDDRSQIRRMYEKTSPERVIVAGGDGTVKMVGEALANAKPVIGILPAGSANGLAVDLDFPKNTDEILQIAFQNAPLALDMVIINGHKSIHLADIGLNAELIKNYENGTIRGKLGYALLSQYANRSSASV